jgi:hypothetical protein
MEKKDEQKPHNTTTSLSKLGPKEDNKGPLRYLEISKKVLSNRSVMQ